MQFLLVGIGGFLGAIARYLIARSLTQHAHIFPHATLLVNFVGSLLLGSLFVVMVERQWATDSARIFAMVGFLGAFTTFSTFSLETVLLAEAGEWGKAALNVALNLLLCVLGTLTGLLMARHLVH